MQWSLDNTIYCAIINSKDTIYSFYLNILYFSLYFLRFCYLKFKRRKYVFFYFHSKEDTSFLFVSFDDQIKVVKKSLGLSRLDAV